MTLTDQPGDDAGPPVIFDLEEVDGGTQLTIRQDRSDFTDEQVAATIAGYNAFIDDIEQDRGGNAPAETMRRRVSSPCRLPLARDSV